MKYLTKDFVITERNVSPKRIGVLFSGGMDSATVLALLGTITPDVVPIFINYGQLAMEREQQAAVEIAAFMKIGKVVQLDVTLLGRSTVLEETSQIQDFYIPHINMIRLIYASAWGLSNRVYKFAVGWQEKDVGNRHSNTIPEFALEMSKVLSMSAGVEITIVAPFSGLDKAGIIAAATQLDVPLGMTYSCHAGGIMHCGECPSCLARIAGFKAVGIVDPAGYFKRTSWAGCKLYVGAG